jgi:hypothetical protein
MQPPPVRESSQPVDMRSTKEKVYVPTVRRRMTAQQSHGYMAGMVNPHFGSYNTETIAERGDVLLKIGEDEQHSSSVLVSSVALSMISPVFEAMFRGKPAGGKAMSADSPHTFLLTDDDAAAIRTIYRIAHFKTAELPVEMPVHAFADYAMVCEKYQCSTAVQAWSRVWVMHMLRSAPMWNFEKVIFATYVPDMPEEFYEASLIITRDRAIDAKVTMAAPGDNILPATIFDRLRLNKRECDDRVRCILHTITESLGSCGQSCRTLGLFIVNLRKAGIWPLSSSSVWSTKTKVAALNDVPMYTCHTDSCPCHDAVDVKGALVKEMDIVYRTVKGICLDCVKRDALRDTRKCRIKHDLSGRLITSSLKSS